MLDCRNKLCVLYDDSVTIADVSNSAADFTGKDFTVTLDVNKYLYIGYNKPVKAIYSLLQTANTLDVSLIAEYYNGTSWVSLELCDETDVFKSSGLISHNVPSDLANATVAGKTQCFIRLSSDAPTDAILFRAINILFSDDTDIGLEFPAILQECYYPASESNFIKYHVTARNYIMQRLRSLGYIKSVNGSDENINEWDILDIFELRQASLYYAMSQIFFTLSDNQDDNFFQKYQEYQKKFEESMALGALRVDRDNDGQVDIDEKLPIKSRRWVR
jgi:hypothetical protein